jgi:NAD-dependent dihydropyrimidine dehydrogenase PreA subunit
MKKPPADVVPGDRTFFPVTFDANICNGCNKCVEVCQVDVFGPNPVRGKPPLVLFPQECWQEGSCVEVCPRKGAIRWERLPMQRVHCKRKETGEDYYI